MQVYQPPQATRQQLHIGGHSTRRAVDTGNIMQDYHRSYNLFVMCLRMVYQPTSKVDREVAKSESGHGTPYHPSRERREGAQHVPMFLQLQYTILRQLTGLACIDGTRAVDKVVSHILDTQLCPQLGIGNQSVMLIEASYLKKNSRPYQCGLLGREYYATMEQHRKVTEATAACHIHALTIFFAAYPAIDQLAVTVQSLPNELGIGREPIIVIVDKGDIPVAHTLLFESIVECRINAFRPLRFTNTLHPVRGSKFLPLIAWADKHVSDHLSTVLSDRIYRPFDRVAFSHCWGYDQYLRVFSILWHIISYNRDSCYTYTHNTCRQNNRQTDTSWY